MSQVSKNQLKVKAVKKAVTAVKRRRGGKSFRKSRVGKKGRSRSKIPSVLTPANKRVWLKYVSVQTVGVFANKFFGYPIYSNGAFAPDPSSPATYTTTPGFSVPALQYAAYRVIRYKGKIAFLNLTATPADTVVCHTNSNLGANNGGSVPVDILQFAANRPTINTVRPIQASGTGPCRAVHTFRHSVSKIAGESTMQPGYKALTNTVPAILTYIVFGWNAAANVVNGMEVSVELEMEVEFLDYIDTLTSFASEDARLASLGKPEISKCAGCKAVEQLEMLPCPDVNCSIVDTCTNCGFARRCSENCQSPRCPFRADTVKLIPPIVRSDSKSKF